MTVSRPPSLRVGDEVLIGGAAYTVTGLSGYRAWLADVTGAESSVALADLLRAGVPDDDAGARCAASARAAGQPSRRRGGPGSLVGGPHHRGDHRYPAGGRQRCPAPAGIRPGRSRPP